MPRQNRVTPFSTLIATPARGTLMGNRGCLHNDRQEIRSEFRGKRWIICLLNFKGRKRSVMAPGQYTELFFLDEATALAAGHRPCAECQRERFNLFRETWARANPELVDSPRPSAGALDARLHEERLQTGGPPPMEISSIKELPDGVFVTDNGHNAWLMLHHQLLHWSPAGYDYALDNIRSPLRVLTPASITRTLAAGYPVDIHPSALEIVSVPPVPE